MEESLAAYKQYVRRRLAALTPTFASASIGDFAKDVKIPETDDEFTELFVGVQVMLEVIREKISELKKTNTQLAYELKQLERINKFMVGRELKMRQLKREINALVKKKR